MCEIEKVDFLILRFDWDTSRLKQSDIVSEKNMVHKGLWIFVFLNEAILTFFTYSRLRLHFNPIFIYNFILMSIQNQWRIYWHFQIRSLIQNPIILSWDIPLFLAQLLPNCHFQENLKKFKISPVFNIKLLFWSFFIIIKCFM